MRSRVHYESEQWNRTSDDDEMRTPGVRCWSALRAAVFQCQHSANASRSAQEAFIAGAQFCSEAAPLRGEERLWWRSGQGVQPRRSSIWNTAARRHACRAQARSGRRDAVAAGARLMFFPEGQIRVHLYGEPVDMRRSFNGLYALTRAGLKQDPLLCGASEYVAAEHCAVSTPRRHGNLLMSARHITSDALQQTKHRVLGLEASGLFARHAGLVEPPTHHLDVPTSAVA